MPRTIKVTGKGVIKLKPDMTRITITLEGLYPVYEQTIKKSAEDSGKLRDLLSQLGFDKEDIKTLSFDVETRYEGYEAEDKSWKQRIAGYNFRHVFKLEFDSDNARLGRVLYALANAEGIEPEFRISYTVKDREAGKNALLGKAVEDAKAKAMVLAAAAGVELSHISAVDYSWCDVDLEVRPMATNMLRLKSSGTEDGACCDMDMVPDDIEVTDTVTVIWEIK